MRSLSVWSIIICLLSYISAHQIIYTAENTDIFVHDQGGYYNFLPAFFIYNDFTFSYLSETTPQHKSFLVDAKNDKNLPIKFNRYSTGPAILLSPFFGIAHLQAHLQGIEKDGFSAPYRTWMLLGGFFYITLALLLLRNILIRYFDEKTITASLLIIVLGTNLFYYVVYEALMSHLYSFFLFSLALSLYLKWLEKEKPIVLILLGITIGLLANTRITNSIFIIVLILWGVFDFETLKNRLRFFLKHWETMLLALFFACLTFIPQIWYWHKTTGEWIINSYKFDNAQFFFSDPMIGEILWGYKKGWLVYSPLMVFSLLGFFFLYSKIKEIFWGILLYTLLNLYIVSCWWCWWYGGSFGMRPLIESMLPLAFSLSAFVYWVFQHKIRSIFFTIIVLLGIGLNFFQTYQYSRNCIDSFGMTRKSYWVVFGKMPPLSPEVYQEYDKYLLGVYMNEMTWEARQGTKTYNERSEK